MKNLRILITILLAVVLVLGLAIGCAKKEETPAMESMETMGTESTTLPKTVERPQEPKQKEIAGMAYIPTGSFMMGSNEGDDDEKPLHEVYVEEFYMDKYEVTVAQFKQFVDATGYKTDAEKDGWSVTVTGTSGDQKQGINWRYDIEGKVIGSDRMNHPVIHVSWNDAQAYAKWAGKRLPTEAEWEYAACSGSKGYKYSWGNSDPVAKKSGNIADETAKRRDTDWPIWSGYDDGYVFTAPVGSFDPNDFGLFDMTGNVSEWCADWYDANYYASSPKQNPKGPAIGIHKVLRGGSWGNNPNYLRCAIRVSGNPSNRRFDLGFRCAQDVRSTESTETMDAESTAPLKPVQRPEEPKQKEIQDMAYIPAGSFMMGSNEGDDDEKPVHEVYVDAYYMDKYEVTVAQFKQFVDASGYKTDAEEAGWSFVLTGTSVDKKEGINWRHDAEGKMIGRDRMNHPVIHISWNDALAYAKKARKRLPTEAEWEYAARCGGKGYKYSWGNGDPVVKKGGNIVDETLKRHFTDWPIWSGYDDGYVFTAPVGSFDPNDFGLFDMTGNVWEWCADWYDENYYASSLRQNPKGPASGTKRVLRGGSWDGNPNVLRCSLRVGNVPMVRSSIIGFRCAQDVR